MAKNGVGSLLGELEKATGLPVGGNLVDRATSAIGAAARASEEGGKYKLVVGEQSEVAANLEKMMVSLGIIDSNKSVGMIDKGEAKTVGENLERYIKETPEMKDLIVVRKNDKGEATEILIDPKALGPLGVETPTIQKPEPTLRERGEAKIASASAAASAEGASAPGIVDIVAQKARDVAAAAQKTAADARAAAGSAVDAGRAALDAVTAKPDPAKDAAAAVTGTAAGPVLAKVEAKPAVAPTTTATSAAPLAATSKDIVVDAQKPAPAAAAQAESSAYHGIHKDQDPGIYKRAMQYVQDNRFYKLTETSDLQVLLNKAGASLKEDGKPGPKTTRALEDACKEAGVDPKAISATAKGEDADKQKATLLEHLNKKAEALKAVSDHRAGVAGLAVAKDVEAQVASFTSPVGLPPVNKGNGQGRQ